MLENQILCEHEKADELKTKENLWSKIREGMSRIFFHDARPPLRKRFVDAQLIIGSDPASTEDFETRAEHIAELKKYYESFFNHLMEKRIDLQQIQKILILGPGYVESQSIFQGLKACCDESGVQSLTLVDGDREVIDYLNKMKITDMPGVDVIVNHMDFASYLGDASNRFDLIVVANPGPNTTDKDLGVNESNLAIVHNLLNKNGLLLARGEVADLNEFLEKSQNFIFFNKYISGATIPFAFVTWKKG
ncbi:MAG: hypothetical protein ABIJ22_03055 [Patescibacteria group bacterium]